MVPDMTQAPLNAEFHLAYLLPILMDRFIDALAAKAVRDIKADFEHARRCNGQRFRRLRERLEREK